MKYIYTLISFILVISCSNDNGYIINGSVNVDDGTKVYVLMADENNQPFIMDSTVVKSNEFSFKGVSASPEISYLQVEGVNGYVLAILETGNITANLNKDNFTRSTVSGTISNDDFIKYKSETKSLVDNMNSISSTAQDAIMNGDVETAMKLEKDYNRKEQEVILYEWDFIINNLDSYMSALLLEAFMVENKVNKDSIIDVYESFSNRIKVSNIGKNIADLLSQFENPIQVGEIAPDFTAPSIDGTNVTLSEITKSNTVTLLDFWAAWCRPCRVENPNLVRLYKKYNQNGFDILGVSLDRTKEQWEQAIEDDNLPWTQVSNLSFWNDPVARRYSIRAIPQSYLIDNTGTVIGKNLRGNDLEERIKFALSLND
ncbi:MAG: TlpA disulfide reductase family protein [Bacteroidetes bacterium]|nr:TlpA disulfide reductase family protein [Bacteroidota bacterium]MDA1225772.1 TlpA disulfide reductase family protein [Bacteroidota bacterium]